MVDTTNLQAFMDQLTAMSPPGGMGSLPPLPPESGGGRTPDMEPRIARLEADMDHVKRELGEIKADIRAAKGDIGTARQSLATITEKLNHVPTIAGMWTAAIGIVGALGLIVGLIVRFMPHAG